MSSIRKGQQKRRRERILITGPSSSAARDQPEGWGGTLRGTGAGYLYRLSRAGEDLHHTLRGEGAVRKRRDRAMSHRQEQVVGERGRLSVTSRGIGGG